MRFAEPIWLELGALVTIFVALLLARSERLKDRARARLMGAGLAANAGATPSRVRRWAGVVAATIAVAMTFLALARPQIGERWETVDRKGTDLMLVVDTSRSMDADDVAPTRLERTKLAVRDLVEKFPEDRVGLVAFAGDAFVLSPMTLDHRALLDTVDALDTAVVGRGGTNLERAIEAATDALATEPEHQKAVVVLSDGEEVEGHALEAAREAARQGITIDAVGIGGTAGELVPAKDARGRAVDIVRDDAGNAVRSKLDEKTLRAIADAAHGTYLPLGDDGRGLERLYAESLAPRAHLETTARTRRVYGERFELPLAIALGALVVHGGLAVPRRRRDRTGSPRRRALGAATAAAASIALAVALVPSRADASIPDAHAAYANGEWERARDLYAAESAKRPGDARLAFNAGAAAYRAGRFEDARAHFDRALEHADPKLQQSILYNHGNAHFRAGEATLEKSRSETIERWKAAVAAYEGALALDGEDGDARHNLDIVKRRLAELEKEEEKKKEQQQQQQQQQQQPEQQPEQQGGQGQQDRQEQRGDEDQPRPDSEGQPKEPKPEGDRPKNGGASPPRGDRGGLSPEEARALLGALKGEERRPAVRGAGEARPNDAPRKDW